MPIPVLSGVLFDGLSIPYGATVLKCVITLVIIFLLKSYFSGSRNPSERVLHGKVVILTGGTSGVGAAVARNLAARGAQLVLLTRHPLSDPFLVDYIEDLRRSTNNELITAEQVDLADLLSIRRFATQWIDNAPPRRLDMVVLCADEMTPPGGNMAKSKDSAELMTAVNYLGNFHLISILSPALRAQPADRDVRIIAGTCSSYMGGNLADITSEYLPQGAGKSKKTSAKLAKESSSISRSQIASSKTALSSSIVYASTKLALMTFCSALQKHLSKTTRSDGLPSNCHVLCVDPGWTRTPGMLRYLTRGSLWGLLFYLLTYPLWWIILKSPEQGAQSFLWSAMDAQFVDGDAPRDIVLVKECRVVRIMRPEIWNETVQKGLWETSEKTIEHLEKASAMRLAREKTKSPSSE